MLMNVLGIQDRSGIGFQQDRTFRAHNRTGRPAIDRVGIDRLLKAHGCVRIIIDCSGVACLCIRWLRKSSDRLCAEQRSNAK